MSNSIVKQKPEIPVGEFANVDEALRKLKNTIETDEEADLADTIRNLAVELTTAASIKMKIIRREQDEGNENIDGKVFSPIANTLEKATRALGELAKRRQYKVEEQRGIVDVEIERIKVERGGSDGNNITNLIFPYQGANRVTASPVLKVLAEGNIKIDDAIDTEMVEVVDAEFEPK